MRTIRDRLPRVYELERGRYQIDLRGKRLEPIRLTISGGKKRLNFNNKADAVAKAGEIESILLTHGAGRLNDIGQFVSNGDLTRHAQALAIHGKTLCDAAEFYLAHLNQQQQIKRSRPISDLIDEWLVAKANNRNKPIRPESLETLKFRSGVIKTNFGEKRLQEISTEDVEKWTNDMPRSSQTREHYRNIFGQFFNWCRKKHLCDVNPCSTVEIDVTNARPEFMSVEDVKRVLGFCKHSVVYNRYLPMHLVGFFAGVRVKEMGQMSWSNIDLQRGHIFISAEIAKTKSERMIEMEPNLIASLKSWRDEHPKLPFVPENRDIKGGLKRCHDNLKKLDVAFPRNVMRHSYASYFLAKHRSFDRLEVHMGNTKAVLKKHYLRTPTKLEAENYFAIVLG